MKNRKKKRNAWRLRRENSNWETWKPLVFSSLCRRSPQEADHGLGGGGWGADQRGQPPPGAGRENGGERKPIRDDQGPDARSEDGVGYGRGCSRGHKYTVIRKNKKIWFLNAPLSVTASLKQRTEDILQLRRNLKDKDEILQQREIDISCLRGQVVNVIRDLTVDELDDDDEDDTVFLNDEEEDSDTLTYAANGSGSDEEILLEDLETDAEWIDNILSGLSGEKKNTSYFQNLSISQA